MAPTGWLVPEEPLLVAVGVVVDRFVEVGAVDEGVPALAGKVVMGAASVGTTTSLPHGPSPYLKRTAAGAH